ncbi:MAG: TIGR03663 family protein [Opitutaceae bacterium]|nr:TIGR03663 family protein [Opitutaceae bacterium]
MSADAPLTRRWIPWVLMVLVAMAAAVVRLTDLDARPMHADEANQAVKLGALLEKGEYRFDPQDHHGPTLYYFALVPAWLSGERSLAALTETTVRLTPVLFGIAGVMLLAAVGAPLGWPAAIMAAALAAFAPAAVYYSRYFIQETLLVTFGLAAWFCAARACQTRRATWALAAGAFVGLMQASKASAPVFILAAFAAWLIVRPRAASRKVADGENTGRSMRLLAWGLSGFAVMFVGFYSSFFTHFEGLKDALGTYAVMTTRVAGQGEAHDKAWWYYADLFWWHRRGGVLWDQTLFLGLAAAGVVASLFLTDRFARGVSLYLGIVAVVLSATPYKTPWIVIHLIPPMAILAAWLLSRVAVHRIAKVPAGLVFLLCLGLLARQTLLGVFRYSSSERNPLAYVHSSPDVKKVPALAERARPGPVKVISEEYWPLPWYLRDRKEVGYWSTIPDDCDASLLFVSADYAEAVKDRLKGRYRQGYLGLRPGFVMVTLMAEP